jgi:hypothetical protein
MGKRALKRRVESLQRQIDEHLAKIAQGRTRSFPDQGLIRHWETEIAAFRVAVERAQKRLMP